MYMSTVLLAIGEIIYPSLLVHDHEGVRGLSASWLFWMTGQVDRSNSPNWPNSCFCFVF
jgi:hypothetical protein